MIDYRTRITNLVVNYDIKVWPLKIWQRNKWIFYMNMDFLTLHRCFIWNLHRPLFIPYMRMLFCTILTHVQFQYWMTGIKVKILVTSWSCSQAWQGFSDSPNGDVSINEQLSETICLLFIYLFLGGEWGVGC